MRAVSLSASVLTAAVAIAGCADGDRPATGSTAAQTTTAAATRPAPNPAGRRVFERSGCLACHQLGTEGKSGPGNNLAGVGTRMSPAEIRRSLVDAPSRMPSYRKLGRDRLDDLVAFLSALRAGAAGSPSCPDEADCG